MIKKLLSITAALPLALSSASGAFLQWQSEVATGTAAVVTHYTEVTSPILFDVGALEGDRAFEFIVRADTSAFGLSAALIGTFNGEFGGQAIKAKQFNGVAGPGVLGLTDFGVADHFADLELPSNVDVHLVLSSNGIDTTQLYLNGALAYTFNTPLKMHGSQGLGGAATAENSVDPAVDPLTGGIIYGFVSYNSALSADEVAAHYTAFAAPVPEPGSLALAAAAGLLGLTRRGRRSA